MDPRPITAADWVGTNDMLISLWAFVGAMIVFAFCLMLAHAVVPSMVGTGHLPERAASYRPLLYGLSVVFFVVALAIFFNFAVNQVGPIYGIYGRLWV